MEKLKQSHNVTTRWRAYQLRPAGSPPISPEYRAAIEAKRPFMEQMAREQYGIEINAGPFGVDSLPALIGAQYAEAKGVGEAYHTAVFQAYWQLARKIDDLDVLADIADSVGLDRQEFLAALEAETYQQAVMAEIQQAYEYGLSGVPALVYNQRYLVVGAQPYEMLAQVAEKARAAG